MKRRQPYEAVSAYLNNEITLLKLESLIIPNLLIGKGMFWPWSTKWSRAKDNRVLPTECTGHTKHPPPTTQETTLHMDITKWSIPKSDWLYSLQPKMEKLCTVSKNKTGSWLRSAGSDHELLIAKFRFKLKKVGKTTRPFRYDLNQIPYDYTVEVTNRFKGLDLMECLKNYGWRFMTLYRR